MAKDFLYKTIEFSKVEAETPYMITRIKPIFSSEVYAEHPDEKFEYTSIEKMEAHLLQLLGYTSAQIALLPLESVTSYYEPLYNIKWYIGGLFDFMQTDRFISKPSTEINELFIPLIDDSKIDAAQNELLGFAFPERMMELIRNKPINRMRMFVNAAKLITETVSELVQYNNFSWITTNLFIPDGSGKTVGIKIKGSNDNDSLNTYLWVVFAPTTNPDAVSTQFNPSHDRYIGISCNNKTNTVKVTKNSGETWPYSWAELPTSESDNSKLSYIFLGPYTYNCYIRYSNNKITLNTNSFDSRGNFYQYIGICLSLTGLTFDHNIADNYVWRKITDFNNIIKYDVGNKRYYLYIRFVDKDNVLSDLVIPSKTIYIKLSYFNETNNKDNNHIYNDVSLYEGTISYNIFNKYTYNHLGNERVAWVKFADTLDASGSTGSNHLYDYAIYKDNESNTYKIRKYMYISINHAEAEDDPIDLSNSKYYKIQLDDLTSEYAYSAQIVNENNQSPSNAIFVKFSNSILPPTILENTQNNYSLNDTNYILVSITDKNGQLHGKTTNNQNSTFDEYEIIVTVKEQQIPTTFEKNRYAYFTYVDEIADPKKRSQYPITHVNGENKNKKYFGYSLVNRNQLSNSPRQIQKPDESSKEITLYRATGLNALTEANISKITSINIPYSTMGKFSVFNFEPIIINDNEYLIIGGNRDNTCVLTCDDSASFQWSGDGEHQDYTLKNTDNSPEHGERKIVNGDTTNDENIMYYTRANFINNTEWSPVYDRYLPIDIGCGYAASSNEVQVTTKSFNDIVEETKINDAAALKEYQKQKQEENGHYKSPNYDLYVNLTYKFAKIIDGNIDYMPLYNRYKIKYKFKNENQVILEKKVFDTSVITPDGSIYNKPDQIVLNGETYGKTTSTYINYFDYIEGDFTDTIKATDVAAEVKDNDYDVAYFQCNNILEQIYQTNYDDVTQGQLFNENYYNYKWLADGGNKDKLPVLCEITISAYDTATPLFTRVIPVTLAAYSLIEVTDDYIKSTVSKIENDYIYGLTQRTSRIEQYADRISMSVLNIGQGLYSRMQMTEDRILMEVVDASKQIGSAFNMYTDKILQMVYDVSNNMYSQILVEQLKISLEVSNNFRKAGIYLTDKSAKIDAPDIILHGEHTTIKGALSIHLQSNDIDGFIMYDISNNDKIHITVEDVPSFEQLGGFSTATQLYFTSDTEWDIELNPGDKTILPETFRIDELATLFYAYSRNLGLSKIKIDGTITDPFTHETFNFDEIFNVDNYMTFYLYYSLKPETTSSSNSLNSAPNLLSASIVEQENNSDNIELNSLELDALELDALELEIIQIGADEDIIYGDGEPTLNIYWYRNHELSKNELETIEVTNAYSNSFSIGLYTTNVPSDLLQNLDITFSNDEIITLITTSGFTPLSGDGNSRRIVNIYFNESNLTYQSLLSTITASISGTVDETVYSDSASFILDVKKVSEFYWEYNNSRVTEGTCYTDKRNASILPHIKILGSDINLSNIQYSGTGHGIDVRSNGEIYITWNLDNTDVTITATYGSTSKECIIRKATYYSAILFPPEVEVEPDFDDEHKTLLNLSWEKINSTDYDYIYRITQLNISKPQDIKLILSNNYMSNSIKILQIKLYRIRVHNVSQFNRDACAGNWAYLTQFYGGDSVDFDTGINVSVKQGYQWYADITNRETPKKGLKTYRMMLTNGETRYNYNFYNIIEIRMASSSFNDINVIAFYEKGSTADNEWHMGTVYSKRIIYKRTTIEDPIVFSGGRGSFIDQFNYVSEFSMYNVDISLEEDGYIVFIKILLDYELYFNSNWYNNAVLDFHVCSNTDLYNLIPTLDIYEINYCYLHPLTWRLQTRGADVNKLTVTNLSIYTNLSYFITAGTRIGDNGMYSYIDQKSLFYFNEDMIAMRNHGNGFRLKNAKVAGQPYEQSSGLEVFVGGDQWSNGDWFSIFNFTPLLRFYLAAGGVWKYPKLLLIWDSLKNEWVEDTRPFPSSAYVNDIRVANKVEALAARAGWDYGSINSLGQNDQTQYYYWKYDASYHKGMLSMEQFCGQPGDAGNKIKHFILLPMHYYNDSHQLVKIPAGYTITIINSQFFMKEVTWNKGTSYQVDGFVGWRKQPLYVGVYDYPEWENADGFTNRHFIFGNKRNGTYSYENNAFTWGNWPGNFVDGHGDICAAIQLTYDDGSYLGGDYVQASTATFIWTGYVWHSSIDVDSNYQFYGSGDG